MQPSREDTCGPPGRCTRPGSPSSEAAHNHRAGVPPPRARAACLLVARLVVFLQEVASEIAREIAPYRVDVVRAVLGVVVFDRARHRLNPVVVGFAHFTPAPAAPPA